MNNLTKHMADDDQAALVGALRALDELGTGWALKEMEDRLQQVNRRLKKLGKRREYLGFRVSVLRDGLEVLQRREGAESSLLGEIFRGRIEEIVRFLDITRPNEELNEKAELRKQIELAKKQGELARGMLDQLEIEEAATMELAS